MSVELNLWVKGLSREQLEKVAEEAVQYMIDGDDLRFDPYDDDLNEPHYTSCGIVIGEDE